MSEPPPPPDNRIDNPADDQADDEGVEHHLSERQKREKKTSHPNMQPPLTPMIDVVFQLLLFFLLGCKFVQDEGQIKANLPDVSGPPNPSLVKEPVKIQLMATGVHDEGVLIEVSGATDKTLANASEVWDLLVALRNQLEGGQEESDIPVIITPDERVQWKFVVDTFNHAVRAKYKNVGFSTPAP